MSSNILKKVLLPWSAIFILLLSSCPASGITRANLLHHVFESLGIAPVTNNLEYSDVSRDHPFSSYIGTARALGIIFPGERFYPDMEITRAESIMFIFKSMGWTHEAALVDNFYPPTSEDIPPYISPYLVLGKQVEPGIPDHILKDPATDLLEKDLHDLLQWIRKCQRENIQWHRVIQEGSINLVLHREGIGAPPESWSILIREFEKLEQALNTEIVIKKLGLKTYIAHNGCTYSLFLGPFENFVKAWNDLQAIPDSYNAAIVPTGGKKGKALFWSAIVSNPGKDQISIVTAPKIGGHRLPISHIANNTEALASINGGFFAGKHPIGSLVVDGFPISLPFGRRSAVGWNSSGEMIFSSGAFRTSVRLKGRDLPISYMNRIPQADSIALFTRQWGTFAASIPPDAFELTVRDNRVRDRKYSSRSNHFLPEEGYLLVGRGKSVKLLESTEIDSSVDVLVKWEDTAMERFSNVVQAGPLLVRNGLPAGGNEGFSPKILNLRHPRTVVGTDGEKMLWIVIDGRDSWHSSGLTLDETKRFLLDIGIQDALNLDGGGSSELWWQGRIINSLPGGRERKLPYCIIFK